MLNRSIVLMFIGAIWLTACNSSTPVAAPTRVPILPSPYSAKSTLPPVGAKVTPSPDRPTNSPTEPAATPDKPASATSVILFRDDFDDPKSGWDVGTSNDGAVGYDNDEYVINVKTKLYSLWANPGQSFDDVSVEVEAYRTAGPDENEMGVICQYQDVKNFIYALVTSDGYYGIGERRDGEPTILTGKGKLIQSDAVIRGDAINRIQLNCVGGQYTLVVNGEPIDVATTAGFGQGDVGLLAGTFEVGDVTIHFDNFLVTTPTDVGPIMPQTAAATALYQDDFGDPKSGWDSSEGDNGLTDYGTGDYVIRVDKEKWQLWANPNQQFDDVSIEVDATPTAGPDENEMGVICRYQDTSNFMYAAIGSDGYYGIYEIKDGKTTVLTGDGQLQPSDAIALGRAVNHIQLVCNGVEFTLAINGQKVASVSRNGWTGGDIGLLAGTFDRGGVEIHFDDFVVTTP